MSTYYNQLYLYGLMSFRSLRLYSLDTLYDIFIETSDIKAAADLTFGKASLCCYKIHLTCLMTFKARIMGYHLKIRVWSFISLEVNVYSCTHLCSTLVRHRVLNEPSECIGICRTGRLVEHQLKSILDYKKCVREENSS